jgi:hypothetical protein
LAVAPDGRTTVALDARRDELAVVDLRSGRLRARVEAGADPSSVVFLDQFAIVRNARSSDLTWVDLTDPTKSNTCRSGPIRPRRSVLTAMANRCTTLPPEQQVATLHVMMGRPMVMDGMKNTIAGDVTASVANRLDAVSRRRLVQRRSSSGRGAITSSCACRVPHGAHFELAVTRTGPGRRESCRSAGADPGDVRAARPRPLPRHRPAAR